MVFGYMRSLADQLERLEQKQREDGGGVVWTRQRFCLVGYWFGLAVPISSLAVPVRVLLHTIRCSYDGLCDPHPLPAVYVPVSQLTSPVRNSTYSCRNAEHQDRMLGPAGLLVSART